MPCPVSTTKESKSRIRTLEACRARTCTTSGSRGGMSFIPSGFYRRRRRPPSGPEAVSVEDLAGVEDAVGVERCLDPPHELQFRWLLERRVVGLLLRADPVLAGD